MWIGEQIDEYGIGNGISLIIMAGIVARLPAATETMILDPITHKLKEIAVHAGRRRQRHRASRKLLLLILLFITVVVGL